MQSFIDRRSILSIKKRQETGDGISNLVIKSITTPNSPRGVKMIMKQVKHIEN